MISNYGYTYLMEKYSAYVGEDRTGILYQIQSDFIRRLKEQYGMQNDMLNYAKSTKNDFAMVLTVTPPMPIYGAAVGGSFMSDPFYDECIEIGKFINGLKGVYFHSRPYVRSRECDYQNQSWRLYQGNAHIDKIPQDRFEMIKQEILAMKKHKRLNVIYKVYTSSNWTFQDAKSHLSISGCHVPKNHLKYVESWKPKGEWCCYEI
jgi:hypothetical protein